MKFEEKKQARRLRSERGWSLGEIAEHLNVSKNSVSRWVRDINLSKEHEQRLWDRNPIFNGTVARRGDGGYLKAKELRSKYQEQGKTKAQNTSHLFVSGCMLYWAEGTKNKNSIRFSNSDPDMILFFKRFLDEEFKIDKNSYRIHIHAYTNNGLTVDDIEKYWLDLLRLNRSNLTKTTIPHKHPMSKGLKKNKLLYGVCTICVNSTEMIQQIFGAIKEIAGSTNPDKWLD